MSILDFLSTEATRHPQVNENQHATLLNSAMEMFGNSGGLSNLLRTAESAGLGQVVGSWIGTGPNQSVSQDQVQTMVGQDEINSPVGPGSRPGLPSAALARILPVLVDKLTPHGKLPEAA